MKFSDLKNSYYSDFFLCSFLAWYLSLTKTELKNNFSIYIDKFNELGKGVNWKIMKIDSVMMFIKE